jgi:hypothetical protein
VPGALSQNGSSRAVAFVGVGLRVGAAGVENGFRKPSTSPVLVGGDGAGRLLPDVLVGA